jgi:hypothetical protein
MPDAATTSPGVEDSKVTLTGPNVTVVELPSSHHRIGTAFAFLGQIALTASVWHSYTQWLWRSVKETQMTVGGLNAAFGIDTSILSFLNVEMLWKVKVGSVMAFLAW